MVIISALNAAERSKIRIEERPSGLIMKTEKAVSIE